MSEKSHWVIDYETLPNCSILCAEHFVTEERKEFVIHKLRNDTKELLSFLEQCNKQDEWHVSYNGLAFDSQISEVLFRNREFLKDKDADIISAHIYKKAQNCIERSENKEFQEFSEKQLSIRQIDVFKLNHWDNPAKRSSLKWIQYSMDWENIQEMPIHHSTLIETQEQIDTILTYCWNDVRSTKRIMNLSADHIRLRGTLTKEYNINLYSASEPRISKELFMHFLSEKTGISKYELRSLRTNRERVVVKDIILPYVEFQTQPFKDMLFRFNNLIIGSNTKGAFKYSLNYRGVRTDYGLGGMHGARKGGIYESTEDMIIMSSDVKSYYPNLAIKNKWSPAHLPKKEFCDQYQWFYDERIKIPRKDPRNYVYKIILNSTFGLSIDKNSFLYDPQFGMQVTINGQLLLSMLYEMLCEKIPGAVPIMQNTDGLEMLIPAKDKELYLQICKEWEQKTSLELEHDQYKKIILSDVNNYIAILESGSIKSKGRFEFKDLALHKNKSYLIVPKAISAFFIDNIPPEKFLSENRNIYDYCAGVKATGDWLFKQTCIVDGEVKEQDLHKIVRYYISNKGCKFIKKNLKDGRKIQPEAGKFLQTLFNQYEEKTWLEYDVNDQYYLDLIYREIANIIPPKSNQLKLL